MIKNSELTFESYFPDFELELLKTDRSVHTVKNYLCDLHLFKARVHKMFPAAKINEIDAFTLQRYRGYLDQTEKRAASTINRRIQSLRRFFSWALKSRHVEIDPYHRIEAKKRAEGFKTPFTP